MLRYDDHLGPSIAVELSWALLAAERDQLRASHPALEALLCGAERPATGRVRSFWSDGCADFGEQIVLADQAAVLASVDIDEPAGCCREAAAHSPKELRLASGDGSRPLGCPAAPRPAPPIGRLRRDYLQLLSDLWSGLAATWDSSGRPLVELAAERSPATDRAGREMAGGRRGRVRAPVGPPAGPRRAGGTRTGREDRPELLLRPRAAVRPPGRHPRGRPCFVHRPIHPGQRPTLWPDA